jgi:cytochrome c553
MKNRFLRYVLVMVFASSCFVFSQDSFVLKGQEVYKKRCFGCHGQEGDVKAFGVSRKLVDLTAAELTERFKVLSDKKMQGVGGASGTMHKQISAVSKDEYEAVLAYVISVFAKADDKKSSNTTTKQDTSKTTVPSAATPNRSQGQLKLVVTANGTSISQ